MDETVEKCPKPLSPLAYSGILVGCGLIEIVWGTNKADGSDLMKPNCCGPGPDGAEWEMKFWC